MVKILIAFDNLKNNFLYYIFLLISIRAITIYNFVNEVLIAVSTLIVLCEKKSHFFVNTLSNLEIMEVAVVLIYNSALKKIKK